MRDARRGARWLLGRLLLAVVGLVVFGLGCLAVAHTASRLGQAAGLSDTRGWYVLHICPPGQETARDTCSGKFIPDDGEPVYAYTFEEDVPPRGVIAPVWCEAGECHPTGGRAVSYWLALTLAGLVVLPAGVLLVGSAFTDVSNWNWIYPSLPRAVGLLIGLAFLCLFLSGKGGGGEVS
ncbi:hypothetical protein [Kitasatospora sp. NPDC056181]|uniref:hypothetical protein n=1 Tax=Kitasatospora sp. NPDC056181 TaxID=3345737 RepID=UPI0035E26BA7